MNVFFWNCPGCPKRHTARNNGNFLNRITPRQQFANQGMVVAVVDKPSDRKKLFLFRKTGKHAKDIKAVMASYQKVGQRRPIVVVGDMVIAGNGQLEAARRLGWVEIATTDASDLSPEQQRFFALADNRTAELASWDLEPLSDQLKDLVENFDVKLEDLGFDEAELTKLTMDFKPVGQPTAKLDQSASKIVHHCPKCGHDFSA